MVGRIYIQILILILSFIIFGCSSSSFECYTFSINVLNETDEEITVAYTPDCNSLEYWLLGQNFLLMDKNIGPKEFIEISVGSENPDSADVIFTIGDESQKYLVTYQSRYITVTNGGLIYDK